MANIASLVRRAIGTDVPVTINAYDGSSAGPPDLVRTIDPGGLKPLPPPPEESRLHGVRHSKARDASAIAHHYDVSNEFYRLVLGPSMTYSCAVWSDDTPTVDEAQLN